MADFFTVGERLPGTRGRTGALRRRTPSSASSHSAGLHLLDPEANQTTEGSVPNYAGLMTWLHDHMSKGGKSAG